MYQQTSFFCVLLHQLTYASAMTLSFLATNIKIQVLVDLSSFYIWENIKYEGSKLNHVVWRAT